MTTVFTREPKTGDLWAHYNGNVYRIVTLTNLPDDDRYPKTVVYKNVDNSTVWSRPLSDWHRSFTFIRGTYG